MTSNQLTDSGRKGYKYLLTVFFLIYITDSGILVYTTSTQVLFLKLLIELAFVFGALLLTLKGSGGRKMTGFLHMLVLLSVAVISTILYTVTRSSLFSFILLVVFAWLSTQIIDYEDFKETFVNVMTIISVATIILFLLVTLFPESRDFLPKLQFRGVHSSGMEYVVENVTIGLANIDFTTSGDVIRGKGPFWEPGVFPGYAAIAVYFAATLKKINIKKIIIILIACLTTLSTAAFAVIILLLAGLLNLSSIEKKTKKRITIAIAVFVVVLVIYFAFISSFGIVYVWNKISFLFTEEKFDPNAISESGGTSFLNRFASFFANILVFFNHPFIGVGIGNSVAYSNQYADWLNGGRFIHQTSTLTNYFASFGLFGGLVCILGWVNFFKIDRMNILSKILFAAATVIALTNENLTFSALFIYVIFIGINKYSRIKAQKISESITGTQNDTLTNENDTSPEENEA